MRPAETIDKLIKKLHLFASAELDERVHSEISKVMEESKKTKSAILQPNIWRTIMKSPITKIAAAAVIIIAVLIGIKMLSGSDKENGRTIVRRQDITQKEIAVETPKETKADTEEKQKVKLAAETLEAELKDVEQMFAAGDVTGLVDMLDKGQWESKVAAANYLAQIGNLSAINALENLAQKWDGEAMGNPFAIAVSKIENRLEKEKQEAQLTKKVVIQFEPTVVKETPGEVQDTVTYKGLVTNEAGDPVQDVNVRCDLMYHRPWKFTGGEAHASTNMQGLFQIGPLPVIDRKKGSRTLIFEHPDYAIGWFTPDWSRDIDPNSIKIKLLEPSFVAGRIVDEQGNPIEAATVHARIRMKIDRQYYYYYFGEMNNQAVISDAEGYFYFEKIPNVAKVRVGATKQGYATYSTRDDYPGDSYPIHAGQEDVIIKLKPGMSIRGQLVYDGFAYKEKDIIVYAQGDNNNYWGKTNENGQFEIPGLREGNYSIIVDVGYLSEAGLSCTAITNFEAILDDSIPEVELVLQKGLSVKLKIVDEDTGEPVRKVPVRAKMLDDKNLTIASGQTNDRGVCTFQLVPGEYNIVAYGWEYGKQHIFSKHLNIKSDDENLEVKLEIKSRPTVWGWLIDANDNPVQGTVTFGRDPVKSDEHGEFAMPEPGEAPEGIYIVYAFDKTKKLGRGFLWKKSADANDLEIVVEPLATIVGKVVDAEGIVVEDLRPEIGIILPQERYLYSSKNPWNITLEKDGYFRFENVPVGLSMKISVRRPGYQGNLNLPELIAGETLELEDIVLKPLDGFEDGETDWTGILTGRVINENNEPMLGLRIHSQTGGKIFEDATDTKGRYKLKGLPKGKKISGSVYADGYGHTMFKTVCDGNDLDIQLFPQGWELLDKKAPGLFVEKWLNTEPVTLEQYHGKVVLLQIGILLPHYSQEFERIQNVLKKYGSKGLQVIGVHERLSVTWGGKVTEQDIQAFIEKHDIKFPFGIDGPMEKVRDLAPARLVGNGAMHSLYDVKATPALYLIDKKGILRISPTRDNLDKWIKQLLQE